MALAGSGWLPSAPKDNSSWAVGSSICRWVVCVQCRFLQVFWRGESPPLGIKGWPVPAHLSASCPYRKKTKKPPLRQFKLCGFFLLLLLNNTTQIFLIASLLHQHRLISYLFSQPTFYPLTIFSFDSSLSLSLSLFERRRLRGWFVFIYFIISLLGKQNEKEKGGWMWLNIYTATDRQTIQERNRYFYSPPPSMYVTVLT